MFRREVRAAHHFVAWLALLGPDQAWYKANNILPRTVRRETALGRRSLEIVCAIGIHLDPNDMYELA